MSDMWLDLSLPWSKHSCLQLICQKVPYSGRGQENETSPPLRSFHQEKAKCPNKKKILPQ